MRRPTHRWHLTLLGGLGLSVGCARLDTLWSNATLRDGAVDPDALNVAVREPVDPRPLASDDAGGPAITPDPVHDPDLADAAMPTDVVVASNPDAASDASVTGDGAMTADGATVDTRPTITALASRTGIVEAPAAGAHWIGYVRVGGRIPIVRGPVGNDGCPARRDVQGSGWYEVEGGGYVCVGNLAVLSETLVNRPMSRRLPVTPDLTADMPFQYARNYRAAVMYRWLPSIEDEREVEPERFAPRERPAPPPPAVDGDASVEPAVAPSSTPTSTDAGAATPDTGVRIEDLVGDPSSPLLRRMTPRMYVSLNRQVVSRNGSAFWHTQSGGYVRSSAMSVVSDAPTFHGVRLDATHHLPMAFALSATTNTYQSGARGAYTVVSRAPRLTVFQLADENPITAGGNQYYRTVEGFFVNSRQVRTVTRHDAPDDLAPGEKWVDVNLSHQSLVAYEGQTPVYVTVMSSGRRNRSSTENYETVQGAFRIESKHVATTMDGNTANDGPYSIEDVPWVMYFEGSFALHGAFWHNGFGMVHSHGCVNLSPPDARFMFGWTEPQVPTGWHAVYASPAHPGTRVYVHYDEQPLGTRGGPTRVPQH